MEKLHEEGKFYLADDLAVYSGDDIVLSIKADDGKAYFTSNGSNVQDYVTSWEDYVDLVKLLDDGFDKISLTAYSK